METIEALIKDVLHHGKEEEHIEFKMNYDDGNGIGEYISALSNAALLAHKDYGYLLWGVSDEGQVLGTVFNYQMNVKGEPLEHYLARKLTPDISFKFLPCQYQGHFLVLLQVPAATYSPTAFNHKRFIRIGSSKVDVSRYPEREKKLFEALMTHEMTLENLPSEYDHLTFERLFTYCAGKGLSFRAETFKQNLGLLTKKGNYNLLAQLISDNSHMPIRVSIFSGETKASKLLSVREFGMDCIFLSLEKILEYGDVLNFIQTDESSRRTTRQDIPLFDKEAFREALINAFVHNKWTSGNAPMISVFRDRIEILSRGSIDPRQTLEGFYRGESVPVNKRLSDLFLQLHISERSGRGVPIIVNKYGKNAYDFREQSITVTLPFNWIYQRNNMDEQPIQVKERKGVYLSSRRRQILDEIINEPHITQQELMKIVGIGKTAMQNNIRFLKDSGFIKREGSNKSGYWIILKED